MIWKAKVHLLQETSGYLFTILFNSIWYELMKHFMSFWKVGFLCCSELLIINRLSQLGWFKAGNIEKNWYYLKEASDTR